MWELFDLTFIPSLTANVYPHLHLSCLAPPTRLLSLLKRFYFASALSKSRPRLEVFCITNCITAPSYHGFTQRTSPASIPEPFRQHAQEYVVGFSPSSVSIRFHSKGRQRVWRMINAFLRVTMENSPTELQLHTGLSRLLLSHHHLPCTPDTQRLLPPSYTFLLSTICFSPSLSIIPVLSHGGEQMAMYVVDLKYILPLGGPFLHSVWRWVRWNMVD